MLLTKALDLSFPVFNGFLPFVANPLLLLWLLALFARLRKKQLEWADGILVACYLAKVVVLCLHRTLGGWQFGARYLVDPFPFCLLFFARRHFEAGPAARELLLAAILFNFYGAVYMLNA